MQKTTFITFSSLACLLLVACAKKEIDPITLIPQEEGDQIYKRISANWDENGDGKASCEDIVLGRQALFKALDLNNDQIMQPAEYRLAKFEDKSFVFFDYKKADTDESNHITFNEFSAVPNSLFQGLDTDGSCLVSREEALRSEIAAIQSGERRGSRKKDNRRSRQTSPDDELLPIPEE